MIILNMFFLFGSTVAVEIVTIKLRKKRSIIISKSDYHSMHCCCCCCCYSDAKIGMIMMIVCLVADSINS